MTSCQAMKHPELPKVDLNQRVWIDPRRGVQEPLTLREVADLVDQAGELVIFVAQQFHIRSRPDLTYHKVFSAHSKDLVLE